MTWQPVYRKGKFMMRKRKEGGRLGEFIYAKMDVTKLGRSTLNPANRRGR
jgi:hypothetical protein